MTLYLYYLGFSIPLLCPILRTTHTKQESHQLTNDAVDVKLSSHFRSGRTARYHKAGNSLAMILPSEEVFIDKLQKHGVTLTKIRVNPQKQVLWG